MMRRYREPRDIWAVVTDSFRLARDVVPRVLVPLLAVALVPVVMGAVFLLLAGVNPWELPGTPWSMDAAAMQAGLKEEVGPVFFGTVALVTVGTLLVTTWAFSLILACTDRMVRGTDSRGAAGRVPALIGAVLLLILISVLVMLPLLFVGGVAGVLADGNSAIGALLVLLAVGVVMTGGSLLAPAVVIERRGPAAAIGRSFRLVMPRFFRVAGVLGFYSLVYLVLAVLASLVAWLALALIPLGSVRMLVNIVLGMLFQAVPMLLSVTMTGSLYYDVIARAEPPGEGAPFTFGS